jgi:hypothetical protein
MKYAVTIQAVITKTYEVESDSQGNAYEEACELFSCECDGVDEDYQQDAISIKLLNEVTT